MNKIKVNECELPIDVLKTGVQVDLSGRYLKVEDVIIIAACINVNSSMTKLAIWDNNIDMENATAIVNAAPAQMRTLCGDMFEEGQAEADLKLITAVYKANRQDKTRQGPERQEAGSRRGNSCGLGPSSRLCQQLHDKTEHLRQ